MAICIELLERRTLLSASPDQLSADLQQLFNLRPLPTDVFSCRMTMLTDFKAMSTGLRSLPHTAANRAAGADLRKAQNQWVSTVLRDWRRLLRADLPVGLRVGKDEIALSDDLSDSFAASRLLADLKTVNQRTTVPLNAFLADLPNVTSALTARLAAVASVNPGAANLQAQTTSETADVNDCFAMIQSDLSAGQSDVEMLISDLSA